MVVAPIIKERVNELKALLSSMNDRPGMAKRDNPIVPFGAFDNLHFARFVILDDPTLRDFEEAGAAIRHPDTVKRLTEIAAEPVGSSPADQEAVLKKQVAQFRPLITELGIKLD